MHIFLLDTGRSVRSRTLGSVTQDHRNFSLLERRAAALSVRGGSPALAARHRSPSAARSEGHAGDKNDVGRVTRLVIIGGGAWGTALTLVARRAGSRVVLWARDDNVVAAINERHENPFLLPGIALDPAIVATSSIDAAMEGAEAALLA